MDIYSARKKYLQKLLAKDGVVSVGVGRKRVKGQELANVCLVVGVRKKRSLSELKKKDIIPEQLGGFLTDVVEEGEISLFEYTERLRPAPPGISIGHFAISAGTFGCVVRDRDGSKMILSNNHVLANINRGKIGDAILQPGAHDGGSEGDCIAQLWNFIPIKMGGVSDCFLARATVGMFNTLANLLRRKSRIYSYMVESNKVDCSIASPLDEGDIGEVFIGTMIIPRGLEIARLGTPVWKVGRTTELTEGVVSQIDVSTLVNMGGGNFALFEDQIAIEPAGFSGPGDSGSAILTEDKVVGLLFAGSDKITMANRIQNVLEALEVTIP